ncbi:cytochrome P450 [Microstroma glucosiphilum]|uniref:Cytochrome P450 n=1 Tax=Pseudomicrostroma glucosiphilum TaxID=1684307 RepID=A0A316TZ94_9BASI|nr:cytochrome P450 [Pseudomicrostroma glucosiphilum]PWN17994.1 cytochrome P450 [Pseudomicrostroma glucosiphilum]
MSLASWISNFVASITDTFGYVLPLTVLYLLYLIIRYPNRLVGTHSDRAYVWTVPGYPLIGNLVDVARRGTKKQFDHFLYLANSCPPGKPNFSWTVPPVGRIVFLNHPAYIEHIQKTNFNNYVKGDFLKNAFGDFIGTTGIFVTDGEEWKRSRKMASRVFSVGQFRRVVTTVVHEELHSVNGVLDAMTGEAGQGTIALPNLFFRYTLSSFAKMAFGADIQCLKPDPACLQEDVPFATAFDSAQEHINNRFTKPGWQLWEKYTPGGKQMVAWTKVMRDFARKIIDDRLMLLDLKEKARGEEMQDRGIAMGQSEAALNEKSQRAGMAPGDGNDKDLLGLFMDMTRDPEELLDVVLNFIIAGRDTTAQSLSWFFIELFAHPEHVQPILDEIALLFPSSATDTSTPNYLAYDDLRQLPYMQACLAESIRLHPPVPKNSKSALQDDVIVPLNSAGTSTTPPPVKVFKGEMVAWSDWVLARLPTVWGEDCAEYKPSRFLLADESGPGGWRFNSNLGPWKFHAFNGGPRLCLGMTLAYFEAMAVLTLILPKWDVKWAAPHEGQVCLGKRPPPAGRSAEEEQRDGWEWPPNYKSSLTHPCEDYSATFVRR